MDVVFAQRLYEETLPESDFLIWDDEREVCGKFETRIILCLASIDYDFVVSITRWISQQESESKQLVQ